MPMVFNFLTPFPQRWQLRCRQSKQQLTVAIAVLIMAVGVQILRLPAPLNSSERLALQEFRRTAVQPQILQHKVQQIVEFIGAIPAFADSVNITQVRLQEEQMALEVQLPARDLLAAQTGTLHMPGWRQQAMVIEPDATDPTFVRVIWTFDHAH